MRINNPLYLLALLLCVLLFSGCSGFKPRAANSVTEVPLSGDRVNIAKNNLREDFLEIVQRGLQSSGAKLLAQADPGVIVLNVIGLEEDKTVSAYSSVRQVREFNHYIELSFSAIRQNSKGITTVKAKPEPLVATVRAERTQIYDSQFVLGVSEEELNIREELRAEVVRLLALRLSVL